MTEMLPSTVMGKVTSVYGVKGWVKVLSYTRPKENLCDYRDWTLRRGKVVKSITLIECKPHGNGLVAKIEGYDDREQARELAEYLIEVPVSDLPELADGDYYWHQLEGLEVYTLENSFLGKVAQMMETGSNDVFVIKPCKGSLDGRERLVPYLQDQVVKNIDISGRSIRVDWDPEF